MDTVELDIASLDTSKLCISKPRKSDDSLFGKISSDDKQVNVHLYNLQVLQHKKISHLTGYYTVLLLKVSKKLCNHFLNFDACCIEQVKSNMGNWFTKVLDENVIEDYYTSSVTISNTNNYVLKLKLQGDDALLDVGQYDFVFGLKGLRFYKQRFIPEWEIVQASHVEGDFMNSIKDNDDEDDTWEDELVESGVIPEPDQETLSQIYDTIHNRLKEHERTLASEKQMVEEKVERVRRLMTELSEHPQNISELDRIGDHVDKL